MAAEHVRPRNYNCLSPDCEKFMAVVAISPCDRKAHAVIWPADITCSECGHTLGRKLSDFD